MRERESRNEELGKCILDPPTDNVDISLHDVSVPNSKAVFNAMNATLFSTRYARCRFGSMGNFITFTPPTGGSFEVNPPFDKESVKAAITRIGELCSCGQAFR